MTRFVILGLACALAAHAADLLEGRVWERDGDDRRPLSKALITVTQEGRGPGSSMTRSDAEGRWRIAGPLKGRYYVSVSRPGYFVALADGATRSPALIDCQGPCGPVEFELTLGGVVNGIVEDDQGEPLQNIQVTLQREGDDGAAPDEPGRFGAGRFPGRSGGFRGGPRIDNGDRTDDLGRFRTAGLPPGVYRIEADTAGRRPGSPQHEQGQPQSIEIQAGQEVEVRVVLQREASAGVTISGVVAGVDLSRPGRHMLQLQPASDQSASRARFGRRMAALSKGGAFEMDGITPGKYFFVYSHYADRSSGRQVQLGSLDVRRSMSGLTLSPVPSLEVSGSFELDTEGEVRSADALLIPVDGAPPAALYVRGADRKFAQGGLYPGVYRIRARSRDWFLSGVEIHGEPVDPDSVSIQADIGDLVILLSDRFARIEGRLRAAASELAPRFNVTVSSGDRAETRPTDQNGGFVFDRLVPGDYRVCARPSDAPRESACAIERNFPVEPGAEIELTLTLPQ